MSQYDCDEATGLKLCSRCREKKNKTEFGANEATRDGLKYFCKPCVNELHRDWAAKNPERVKAARDRSRARRKQAFELLRRAEDRTTNEETTT